MWKRTPKIPLLLVISVIAFLVRVVNLNYNSPFLDEAIYIVIGREIITRFRIPQDAYSWVGGSPLFYPPLSALFYEIGGIAGSRFMSAVLGALSVGLFGIFVSGLRIFRSTRLDRIQGWLAAILCSLTPIHMWLSRMAIYDMLALALLLSGIVLSQRALTSLKEPDFILAAAMLFAAFLTKYSVLLVYPFIAGVILLAILQSKKRSQIIERSVFFVSLLAFIFGMYIWRYFDSLKHFFLEQTLNASAPSAGVIVSEFLRYTSVWYILSMFGLFAIVRQRRDLIYSALLGFALLPLIIHLVSGNVKTLAQNTFFSLLFLIPLSSAWFIWLGRRRPVLGIAAFVFFLLIFGASSWQQRISLEQGWPNSTTVLSYLREVVSPQDQLLAELDDVAVLGLPQIPAENITGPFSFIYQDTIEPDSYLLAIADRHFAWIQLDSNESYLAKLLGESLDRDYLLVYGASPYLVYQRIGEK